MLMCAKNVKSSVSPSILFQIRKLVDFPSIRKIVFNHHCMTTNPYPAGDLTLEERAVKEFQLRVVCPDDGKYAQKDLTPYLSAEAEWLACVEVQRVLLATRVDFGAEATIEDLRTLESALPNIDVLNIALLEATGTKPDQLAVLAEMGRVTDEHILSLLHPGTTSYDILDTARSYLLKKAWNEKMRKLVVSVVEKILHIAEEFITPGDDGKIRAIQVGRTHFQHTSPVPFGVTLVGYAARLSERMSKCDISFDSLR
jgi:adenylosuccinate lyase